MDIPLSLKEYFDKLDLQGIKLTEGQKKWYIAKKNTLHDDMMREYPSCISLDTPILTRQGIYQIQDVPIDGQYILNKFNKGPRPIYEVITSLGYTLKATDDHLIFSGDTFKRLKELSIGDSITLEAGNFSEIQQTVGYKVNKFTNATIDITHDFARLIGYFMGDGSFYKDCLSIACDAQDLDVIVDVKNLVEKFIGDANERITGEKKGCTEIRISRIHLQEPFFALDLIRQNSNQSFKRKINVPWYIKQSPKDIVRQFLIGLFEADGFAQRNGNGVKFFAKDLEFIRDIQLLLLQFGITSRVSRHDKIAGSGHIYTGNELSLRKMECLKFIEEIGFFSIRKNERLKNFSHKAHYNAYDLDFKDTIASISPCGISDVYDLTTSTKKFSAGGIVVHNCPEEAFAASQEGYWYSTQLKELYENGRVTQVSYDRSLLVHTSFDLGVRDFCAIWFFQMTKQGEIRIIDHFQRSDTTLELIAQILKEKGYTYGVHLWPFDANQRDRAGITYVQQAREFNLNGIVLERSGFLDGINLTRMTMSKMWFDSVKCKEGLSALASYKKKWNNQTGGYTSEAVHDNASHSADSLRYLSQGYKFTTEDASFEAEANSLRNYFSY